MGPIRAVAKDSERNIFKEAFHAARHLMKHDRHGDKALERCNPRFVQLHCKFLAAGYLEIHIVARLPSIVFAQDFSEIFFFGTGDLDLSIGITVALGNAQAVSQARFVQKVDKFIIIYMSGSLVAVQSKQLSCDLVGNVSFELTGSLNEIFLGDQTVIVLDFDANKSD